MAKGRASKPEPPRDTAVTSRLADLETRLAAVEAVLGASDRGLWPADGTAGPEAEPSPTEHPRTERTPLAQEGSPDSELPPLPITPAELRRRHGKPGGVLVMAGVRLPRGAKASWRRETSTVDLLDQDWADGAERVAALAHPVRLRLLREVLRGARSVAALACLPGLGSSGQLYHHLRPLLAEGWLCPAGRGRYEVPEHRIGPLMAVVAAANAVTGRGSVPPPEMAVVAAADVVTGRGTAPPPETALPDLDGTEITDDGDPDSPGAD